jgi:hypothetical protein
VENSEHIDPINKYRKQLCMVTAKNVSRIYLSRPHIIMRGIMFIILFNIFISSPSQKVFSVEHANQANVKVFVVKYENQADLKVFKVKYDNQAGDNNGKWFFTEYENQAKKKIYFVEFENQADLKIFFVEYENQAGWRNNKKIHLMY